jgi:site-specific DNA recombinase
LPGISRRPKEPAGSCFRTTDLEAKFDRNSSKRRARLVSAIARGRQWLDDVVSGRVTNVTELCMREKCSVRQINMTISLAFLAPNLVKAAVEGRLPRGIGVERLRDLPTEWSRQFEALGLNPE